MVDEVVVVEMVVVVVVVVAQASPQWLTSPSGSVQDTPPFRGCCTIALVLLIVPSPQVRVQLPHADHSP